MAKYSHQPTTPQDWVNRFLLVGLFLGSLLLVLIGRNEDNRMEDFQQSISGFFAPVGSFLSSPVKTTLSSVDAFSEAYDNIENMERLADENAALLQWKQRAEQLEQENISLRSLLKAVPIMKSGELTAKVLGNVTGPYSHELHIDAGSMAGVKLGMVAVNEHGMIGRITQANANISHILPLTDIHSRIAILTGKGREHAVVKGLGEQLLRLYYLPEDSQITLGEKLYSSGDGGFMPAGILVGTVTKITKTGIFVTPATDRSRLELVRLLVENHG